MLPDIMVLDVSVIANEHAFGASLFHVLRLCSGIKKLKLTLDPSLEVIVILSFYIIFLSFPCSPSPFLISASLEAMIGCMLIVCVAKFLWQLYVYPNDDTLLCIEF